MKAALVSPNEQVLSYTWVQNDKGNWVPNWGPIPDAERIAEVTTQPFDVAEPLFWVSCADNVVADQWYYDKNTQQCVLLVYPPPPVTQVANGGPTIVA